MMYGCGSEYSEEGITEGKGDKNLIEEDCVCFLGSRMAVPLPHPLLHFNEPINPLVQTWTVSPPNPLSPEFFCGVCMITMT